MYESSFVFRFLSKIIKFFLKKPNIINLNDHLSDRAIFLGNHAAIKGPLYLVLFFPYRFIPWGTYEMTGNYQARFKFLYHVIYRKRLKKNKLISFTFSAFFALIAKFLYKNVSLIPTYPDLRLKSTFKLSRIALNHHRSILIFPEDSTDGYLDVMTFYYRGFLAVHTYYMKKEGIDLPIVPFYFDRITKTIVIGKPLYYQTLKSLCDNEDSMLKLIVHHTNTLRNELKTA